MYKTMVNEIRSRLIGEIRKRTKDGKKYVFRRTLPDGEDEICVDLSVANPSDEGFWPDVMSVQGDGLGDAVVTVRDEYGDLEDISISDLRLSEGDLAAILDGMGTIDLAKKDLSQHPLGEGVEGVA